MTLLGVLVPLIVIGLILWLVFRYIPMIEPVKTIITIVAVIVIILWLANAFGVLGYLNAPLVPARR